MTQASPAGKKKNKKQADMEYPCLPV